MSLRSQWINAFLARAKILGRDSFRLAQAAVSSRHAPWKDLLLTEARANSNQVAVRLLEADREFGLLRYYGFLGYMREKKWLERLMPSAPQIARSASSISRSSAATDTTEAVKTSPTSDIISTSPRKNAQVAFMVTTKMKHELAALGYAADTMKSMTPMQASLVLNHAIPPHEYGDRIGGLVVQAEADQQEAWKEAVTAAQDEQQKADDAPTAVSPSATSRPPEDIAPSESSLLLSSIFSSTNSAISVSAPEPSGSTVWYQVVQVDAEKESQVVALYKSREEAEMSVDLHQKLANRRVAEKAEHDIAPTFELRETSKP